MKIIYFIAIVIIIYVIASRIKVVHIDSLEENLELTRDMNRQIRKDKMAVKSSLSDPDARGIRLPWKETFTAKTHSTYPVREFIGLIREQCLDSNYQFNVQNQPVTTRYPDKLADGPALQKIRSHINSWNNVLGQNSHFDLICLRPIMVKEVPSEFIIYLIAKIRYVNETIHLTLTYYGIIDEIDDFFDRKDSYYLKLIDMKSVPKQVFENLSTKTMESSKMI